MDIDLEDWEVELKRTKRLCWVQRHHCEHTGSQFPFCPFNVQECHLGPEWEGHGNLSRVYQLVSGKAREAQDTRGDTALQGPHVSRYVGEEFGAQSRKETPHDTERIKGENQSLTQRAAGSPTAPGLLFFGGI